MNSLNKKSLLTMKSKLKLLDKPRHTAAALGVVPMPYQAAALVSLMKNDELSTRKILPNTTIANLPHFYWPHKHGFSS